MEALKNKVVSKALEEVWEWKEICCREVAHLDLDEAIKKRIADADETARRYGFSGNVVHDGGLAVAETGEVYRIENNV
jgi:hypothetical protein